MSVADHHETHSDGLPNGGALDVAYTVLASLCRLIALIGLAATGALAMAAVVYVITYAAGLGFTQGRQAAWVAFEGDDTIPDEEE